MILQSSSGRTLYLKVVILDASNLEYEEFENLLGELLTLGISDGEAYQLGNGPGEILMQRDVFEKCKNVLLRYGVEFVNP